MYIAYSVLDFLFTASAATTSTGSDETNFLTSRAIPSDSGGLSDVLVVTTTMGVLDGVHSNTTSLGPGVAFHPVLEERATGLEHGLVGTASTSDNSNNGTERNNKKVRLNMS